MNDAKDVLLTEVSPFYKEGIPSCGIVEETQELNLDFGSASVVEYSFDGFYIASCTANVYQNIHVAVEDISPRVSMLFMEHGDVTTNVAGITADFRFTTLEHNLMYTPYQEESAMIKKQADIQVFSLSFTPERFLELADNNGSVLDGLANNVARNRAAMLAEKINPRITPRMRAVMAEIRQCQFRGGLKKLFLQSKAIELLALQCEQIESDTSTGTPVRNKISPQDLERLYHARELLLQNLQQPLSLAQLSRKAGLNEFKLKSGFRAVFDNTVFGYINDRRLDLARELLLAGNCSLTAIAEEAGYSSPQHFSNAFRKKFGVSPGKVRS
ncbi:AraC-like DNA-binding protein [Chitinophaga niastensis]|uniref:AraC-like DNA-binding protein n=2 Tax=Chitinophaga niastensis TaxID=536980 RepID=A0A2P8HPM2_CHINA|nr:AraC-like DNA-binding protein [Chitinophaga niastensis]